VQYQTSQQTRRLIGRLDQGEELVEAITALCRKEKILAAEIRATGALKKVELVRYDASRRQYIELAQGAADVEIVSLTGSVSTLGDELAIRLDGVLLADAPFGPQLLAGQVRSGAVETLEFVIEEFLDVSMRRSLDSATGRLLLQATPRAGVVHDPAPAAPVRPAAQPVVVQRAASVSQPAFREAAPAPVAKPAPTPAPVVKPAPVAAPVAAPVVAPTPVAAPTPAPAPQQMSWQEAAQAAQEVRPAPAAAGGPPPKAGEEPDFKAGDWLDHPTLGRCQIMRVEDDETVHVRMRGAKVGKLVLESFEILFDGEENGRNIFKLRKSRGRD
jgi:predicted DNA-binding protein with PD1-like motif